MDVLTEILLGVVGLLAIGVLLISSHLHKRIKAQDERQEEFFVELNENSRRIAGFSKFMRIVEEAQKRNGGAA